MPFNLKVMPNQPSQTLVLAHSLYRGRGCIRVLPDRSEKVYKLVITTTGNRRKRQQKEI